MGPSDPEEVCVLKIEDSVHLLLLSQDEQSTDHQRLAKFAMEIKI